MYTYVYVYIWALASRSVAVLLCWCAPLVRSSLLSPCVCARVLRLITAVAIAITTTTTVAERHAVRGDNVIALQVFRFAGFAVWVFRRFYCV